MKWKIALILVVIVSLYLVPASAAIPDISNLSLDELQQLQEDICQRIETLNQENKNAIKATVISANDIIQDLSEIQSFFSSLSCDSAYSDLYRCYASLLAYKENNPTYDISTMLSSLFENMKYGRWSDGTNTLTFTGYYSDYNNTSLSESFENNLPNSKIEGQGYYFYEKYDQVGMTIGYEDKILSEQEDNYQITFDSDRIYVHNYVNKQDYELIRDNTLSPIVRDNAKNAYIYIANIIDNFKFPKTFEVIWCYVDKNIIYFKCNSNNSIGGIVTKTYSVSKIDNSYYILESSRESAFSNVDISELNMNIQSYVAKMF